MNNPKVSIIVPVWNTGKSIERMIDSILKQSFRDFELILIDDGSTDNTPEVLKKIKASDDRVVVYSKINGGPSSARNLGVNNSSGKYIQFYDADDEVAPGALKAVVDEIEKNNSDIVVSGWRVDVKTPKEILVGRASISPRSETIKNDIKNYILRSLGSDGTLYNLWNKLFRAEIIKSNNIRFREDISFGEDLIFALNYFRYVSNLQTISNITYYYQESSTGMFSKSAINTAYRQVNSNELSVFSKPTNTQETSDLFHWVEWRWLLSYWKLVYKSDNNREKKVEMIRRDIGGEYVVAKNAKFIGYKKLFIEYIASILIKRPNLAFFAVSIALSISKLISKVKLHKF